MLPASLPSTGLTGTTDQPIQATTKGWHLYESHLPRYLASAANPPQVTTTTTAITAITVSEQTAVSEQTVVEVPEVPSGSDDDLEVTSSCRLAQFDTELYEAVIADNYPNFLNKVDAETAATMRGT